MANTMRREDTEEVWASHRHTPIEALLGGYKRTPETLVAVSKRGEIPLAIFGVRPKTVTSDVGTVWLLGSDEALRHRRKFMTMVPKVLEIWLEEYKLLENYVHVKNKTSVRWLKRLGFQMEEPVCFNTGEHFIRFWMESKNV